MLAEPLRLLGVDVRVADDGISTREPSLEWSPDIEPPDSGLTGMKVEAGATRTS